MNKQAMSGALITLVAGSMMAHSAAAQTAGNSVDELRQQVERLQSEVEYLKEHTKAERKEMAEKTLEINNLTSTSKKFVWNGDFRYRSEHINTASNKVSPEFTRHRDRIRARFGVTAKVNDTINAKIQLATSGGATNDPRSTNQTLGEGWTRKPVAIDLAYVDWKALNGLNIQLGKIPQPWTRTASYFWDGDLTAEGAAAKYVRGPFFAVAAINWLNERHSSSASGKRADTKLQALQVGWKQPIGGMTLTAALGYFNTTNVKDEQISANPSDYVDAGATLSYSSNCKNYNSVFFANSSNGNSTYNADFTNGAGTCAATFLKSGFKNVNALAQLDFKAGTYPMSVFVDYMKNNDAEVNTAVNKTLDDAIAVGVSFNKASAPKSWEASLVYEKNGKDAIFGQFVDSDFGDGKTDAKGWVVKGAYVPAANWTLAATYFINKLNYEGVATSSTSHELNYKRLQLDLNYKF